MQPNRRHSKRNKCYNKFDMLYKRMEFRWVQRMEKIVNLAMTLGECGCAVVKGQITSGGYGIFYRPPVLDFLCHLCCSSENRAPR